MSSRPVCWITGSWIFGFGIAASSQDVGCAEGLDFRNVTASNQRDSFVSNADGRCCRDWRSREMRMRTALAVRPKSGRSNCRRERSRNFAHFSST